jgi:hypothetical protein
MDTDPDYVKVYNDFWKGIVENPDGTLNLDQVQRELFDFHTAMGEVGQVYDHITGGQISKVNTKASAVIAVADEHVNEIVEDELRERAKDSAEQDSEATRG